MRRQSQLALDFFNVIVNYGDMSKQPMSTLALNLWNLAQKHGECDTKQTVSFIGYLKFG